MLFRHQHGQVALDLEKNAGFTWFYQQENCGKIGLQSEDTGWFSRLATSLGFKHQPLGFLPQSDSGVSGMTV